MTDWIEKGEPETNKIKKLNDLANYVYGDSYGSSGTSGVDGSSGVDGNFYGSSGTSGSSGISEHNSLSGLQGGSSGEYYHLTKYNRDILSPIGFYNINDQRSSILSYSGLTFTIIFVDPDTIWAGVTEYIKYTKDINVSPIDGLHFIYYSWDDGAPLTDTTTVWDITVDCPISIAYVQNGEIIMIGDERHGSVMDSDTHRYLHATQGTKWIRGLDIYSNPILSGSPTADGMNTFISFAGGTIQDEDLIHTITNGIPETGFTATNLMVQDLGNTSNVTINQAKLPVWYRIGTGTTNWHKSSATEFPFYYDNVTNYPQYNKYNGGGSYTMTGVTSGNYFISWIFGTNDIQAPVSVFADVKDYSSLESAQNDSNINLVLQNLPSPEYKLLYRAIYHFSTGYTSAVKYSRLTHILDYRKDTANHNTLVNREEANSHPASAIYLDSSSLTGYLGSMNTGITNLQDALEYIDYMISKDGFIDYNHSTGNTMSYIATGTGDTMTDMKVINDGNGEWTTRAFAPLGINDLWNTTTNQFVWSGLTIGDMVTIRTDGDVTTSTSNQIFGLRMVFGMGVYPYYINLGDSYFKAAGTYHVNRITQFYIGNNITKDNPSELYFYSDANATVSVNGFFISVVRTRKQM